jgi:hypothetical protein
VVVGKTYRLTAQDIKPLAMGLGGCVASDTITVRGQRVGYMLREPANNPKDSGWQFMSGTESQEFADDASNFGVFDLNTMANYDPEIIPLLGAPVGSSFVRDPLSGPLRPEQVASPPKPERRKLTPDWSIEIEPTFQGRMVEGVLQLVDPGPPTRTIWLSIWGVPPTGTGGVLDEIRTGANPAALERYDEMGADRTEHRFATWYPETVEGRKQWALYAYTLRPEGYAQAAFIVDDPAALGWALNAWRSLRFRSAS